MSKSASKALKRRPKKSAPKLGIIAGQGDLPVRLADICRHQARDVFVVGFIGQFNSAPYKQRGIAYTEVALGAVGKTIDVLRQNGVRDIVMAGAIQRPSLFHLKLDARARNLIRKIGVTSLGDDTLLRHLVSELEGEGFTVISSTSLMGDEGLTPGSLGAVMPDDMALRDIDTGIRVLNALADQDVGQAVIVQQGIVIGIEAVEGTDGLIARYKKLRKKGPAGVLVKMPKRTQDMRVDVPTIGSRTIAAAAAAGLRGVAVAARGTHILDIANTTAIANKKSIFLYAF